MSTAQSRGNGASLEDIRRDLESDDRTPTQRSHAFDNLRRYLVGHPDDDEALDLWRRHEAEFGREPATTPAGPVHGQGFHGIAEAEREVRGSESES